MDQDIMDEAVAIGLQIEDEREEAAWMAHQEEQMKGAVLSHHANDGCDLDDPHDLWHHDTDDDPRRSHYCNHAECRADDMNDDAKAGF